MTPEEKVPEYIESICRALNIKNEHELNELLSLFYKSNKNNKKEEENEEGKEKEDDLENSEDKNKDNDNDDVSFEKDNVLNILKEFSKIMKKPKEKG